MSPADPEWLEFPKASLSLYGMNDELLDGRRIWILTIVNYVSRVSPAIGVG